MQHTETIVTIPSSSSRTYEDHIFKHLPRNFVFGTSAIQIISAVITIVVKIWISIENDTCSDIFNGSFTFYLAVFLAIPGVFGIIGLISPRKIIFLCKTGSEFFSSFLSLMLVFMGCLGISDLRNPGQWYCSEGDKDRNHAVSYALFALLVIVGFLQICVTVISIFVSCYIAFCATKSYAGNIVYNNASLNNEIWRTEVITETEFPTSQTVRPPDYPPSYSESEQPRDLTQKY